MTDQEIEEKIRHVLVDFFQERDAGTYTIPIRHHYVHHKKLAEWIEKEDEYEKNHAIISEYRNMAGVKKKAVVWGGIGALFTVVGSVVLFSLKLIWGKYFG